MSMLISDIHHIRKATHYILTSIRRSQFSTFPLDSNFFCYIQIKVELPNVLQLRYYPSEPETTSHGVYDGEEVCNLNKFVALHQITFVFLCCRLRRRKHNQSFATNRVKSNCTYGSMEFKSRSESGYFGKRRSGSAQYHE